MNGFLRSDRRSLLKGVSLGAGGLVLAPLLQKIATAAEGKVTTPKRVIFFVFDNGFKDDGAGLIGTDLVSDQTRQFSLEGHKLPLDIEPFAPFQDRMTLLHGMRAHASVDITAATSPRFLGMRETSARRNLSRSMRRSPGICRAFFRCSAWGSRQTRPRSPTARRPGLRVGRSRCSAGPTWRTNRSSAA